MIYLCRGGAAFVATQALGWALFSASCASLLWIIVQIALGFAYCLRSSLLITCAIMGGAYLVSLISNLRCFSLVWQVVQALIWLIVGSLEVAAAITGTPVWGLATIAADQLLDVPKLKDIPKSIRELADENNKLKKSPVGMLFNIHKKNA